MFKKLILVFAITVGFFCLISHQNKWQTKLVYKIKQQEIPLWMLEQISEDLTPFSSGISTAMLDRLVETSGPDNRYALARFQVKGGRLEVV
ncbi:MAG TPA: hypothetical protein VLF61_03945, partial [Rhabdochlamydiaceae bacterium]|nr:hypothetical protein [Rhabdochlamydiaceae bacterium]